MYINKAQLYGNLTRDPEIKALPSGIQVANFSVATNRTWKDKDGKKQEEVEYHNCVAFGKTAEVIGQYLKKGKPVLVEGRIQTRSWEKDGAKQYRTEIVVENFQFGPSPKDGATPASSQGSQAQASSGAPEYPEDDVDPDDIPF